MTIKFLSIYLSITVVGGGGAESFAFSLVSFSFKQPVSTVRVLLSRFNLQQFNVKLLLFFILFEFPFQATTIQLLLTK